MGARYPYYLLADSVDGRRKEGQLTGRPLPDPSPTDDVRHGFVYERVQHITLKSIANNPDITDGMSRAEIDAAIARHADVELLYDKPYEDKTKVRVTGPFTVESLSPHRSLAFAGGPGAAEADLPASEQAAVDDPSGPDFTQTILDNLVKAGIQNGRRQERIELEAVEPYAGVAVHAVGTRRTPDGEDADEAPVRVGLSLGPQYGTVSPAADGEGGAEGDLVVDLLGVDVYDSTTGEVRSRDTDRIALWMLDTDYDGESFFVRHAYFTGGQDPYKKLRAALKAEIDPDAWVSLYRTTSRPFAPQAYGKVAVKVINDYGDEVLQVFDTPAA